MPIGGADLLTEIEKVRVDDLDKTIPRTSKRLLSLENNQRYGGYQTTSDRVLRLRFNTPVRFLNGLNIYNLDG
jgi:hypothetical protein